MVVRDVRNCLDIRDVTGRVRQSFAKQRLGLAGERRSEILGLVGIDELRITSYNVCYTKLLRIGCKVRSIELNVLQRCASHIASKTDLDEAMMIGEQAVKNAIGGKTGVMVVFERISNSPYTIATNTVVIEKIANKEKSYNFV